MQHEDDEAHPNVAEVRRNGGWSGDRNHNVQIGVYSECIVDTLPRLPSADRQSILLVNQILFFKRERNHL